MKQRIKEVKDSNGNSRFYPQCKLLFWWVNDESLYGGDIIFYTLKEAQEYIDYDPEASITIHDQP